MSADQPLTGDELATIKARAEADRCRDKWRDRGEPVCGAHGFLWPDDSEWCNRVEPAARETLRLVAEIEQMREERAAIDLLDWPGEAHRLQAALHFARGTIEDLSRTVERLEGERG